LGSILLPNEHRTVKALPDLSRRLKLVISYDGSCFHGWQSQAKGNTIQDRLEQALASVAGVAIRAHGAGRTDAGVHALGQCAHVDVPGRKLSAETWRNALNASLPPQIRIVRCRFVPGTFHARFAARGKVYRYRIATAPVFSPFEVGRAWHVMSLLDDELLRACAASFAGRHDFAGFAANRGQPPETSIRTIRAVRVRRTAAITTIEFDGEGFLYKMVRLMVGSIVRCAIGKDSLVDIQQRLRRPDSGGARLVAPASGLTLVRVRY
jgi:tRNA pseudouridine38-40 synthase